MLEYKNQYKCEFLPIHACLNKAWVLAAFILSSFIHSCSLFSLFFTTTVCATTGYTMWMEFSCGVTLVLDGGNIVRSYNRYYFAHHSCFSASEKKINHRMTYRLSSTCCDVFFAKKVKKMQMCDYLDLEVRFKNLKTKDGIGEAKYCIFWTEFLCP